MPRFRCIVLPDWVNPVGETTTGDEEVVEIVYEFDAQDIATLQRWLTEVPIPDASILSIEQIEPEPTTAPH
ncbi:MAG: hypothetical protein O3A46_05310 [Candidatus Poribacteria bacterium]|nr:hypothetical protein [Candidatus Poribacteria bacterium]